MVKWTWLYTIEYEDKHELEYKEFVEGLEINLNCMNE